MKMIVIIIAGVVAVFFLSIFVFIKTAPQFGGVATAEQHHLYASSDNFRDGLFHNQLETVLQNPDGSFAKTMRDFIKKGQDRVPSVALPFQKVERHLFQSSDRSSLQITWLGHSSVLIQIDGVTLLTDPMFGQRAAPVSFLGPKRFNDNLPLEPETIPHLDAIILSHDHYDHLDYATIKALHEKTDKFFVPFGVAPHLVRWGVEPDKIIELDWWGRASLFGLEFIAAPARHFSGRRGNDRAKTLWVSWVIASEKHRLYFGGDSGYGPHFKEIGELYGPFDLTMLENGAYNEAWPYVHMMPEQTAQAHLDLKGDILMPIHWAQFNLSLHAWREPIERLMITAQDKKIHLTTPKIGETFSLKKTPTSLWWRSL